MTRAGSVTWHREYLYGSTDEWFMPCDTCGVRLGVGVEAWVKDDVHGDGELARCISHRSPA
jgi:hypothetical protein